MSIDVMNMSTYTKFGLISYSGYLVTGKQNFGSREEAKIGTSFHFASEFLVDMNIFNKPVCTTNPCSVLHFLILWQLLN